MFLNLTSPLDIPVPYAASLAGVLRPIDLVMPQLSQPLTINLKHLGDEGTEPPLAFDVLHSADASVPVIAATVTTTGGVATVDCGATAHGFVVGDKIAILPLDMPSMWFLAGSPITVSSVPTTSPPGTTFTFATGTVIGTSPAASIKVWKYNHPRQATSAYTTVSGLSGTLQPGGYLDPPVAADVLQYVRIRLRATSAGTVRARLSLTTRHGDVRFINV